MQKLFRVSFCDLNAQLHTEFTLRMLQYYVKAGGNTGHSG